ncbi:unnamed protein product [Lactuca saligna]|uniref:Myb/SANT-like DNA-binding domain-containing protein n=1 Tax=Lactuca saligna TaxID=75948 RepID=A0AA35YK44_LACSI|nr:unnamed protein product [Lactuca saligna]
MIMKSANKESGEKLRKIKRAQVAADRRLKDGGVIRGGVLRLCSIFASTPIACPDVYLVLSAVGIVSPCVTTKIMEQSPIEGNSSTPSTPTTAPTSVVSIDSMCLQMPFRNSESPHHSSSTTLQEMINSPGSSPFPRPQVLGVSSSSVPSSSYNIPQTDIPSSGGHQSTKKKSKQWSIDEEVALAKAWIDVSKDPEIENRQQSDSFWRRILEYFSKQLGGTDRTVHQMNSKWKNMHEKMKKFNDIYNNKLTQRRSGQSEADILLLAQTEYRNLFKNKAFSHEAAWGIIKENPPKKTKTSESNTYTTSVDDKFPEEDEGFNVEQPQKPQRKGNKAASSSSSEQQQQQRDEQLLRIVSEFSNVNKQDVEDKKRHRAKLEEFKAEKLRIMEEEKEERVRMMREKRQDKDMQFYLRPHDHLAGAQLNAVLTRKREIAQRWGWE